MRAGAAAGAALFALLQLCCLQVLLVAAADSSSSSSSNMPYDDDLSLTNSEAEEYSAAKCAQYLCPKYSYETKKYLKAGCEGDFADYLPASGISSGQVTLSAALIVVGSSFLGAFTVGLLLGKYWKTSSIGSKRQV